MKTGYGLYANEEAAHVLIVLSGTYETAYLSESNWKKASE